MKKAAVSTVAAVRPENPGGSRWVRFKKALSRDKYLWIMLALPQLYFIIFCYAPMAGLSMAFVDYNPTKGIFGSEFVGLRYFQQFFSSPSCIRVIWNTFYLSFLTLIWGFPAPIIIVLLLNECYNMKFKTFIKMAGGEPINFMGKMEWFRPLYVGSNMWQFAGWTSIIYLSALSAIDPTLYESAKIDGANDITILFRIILPVSKAVLSTLVIYYAVAHWNSYMSALLYLPDSTKHPLQMFLVKVLINNDSSMTSGIEQGVDKLFIGDQLKYCSIVVATIPILCVYPFFQKHFTQGVMVGSVKV